MTTRWLTPQEREAWVTLTGLLIKLPTALDSAMAKTAGLTFFEYMVLAMLSEEESGILRMSTLAERTNGSLSRLSHVVRRLERQGLVRREGAPDDRRATNAILTDAGRQRVLEAAPEHVRFVREVVLDGTTAEHLRTLTDVGESVLERLEDSAQGQLTDRRVAERTKAARPMTHQS